MFLCNPGCQHLFEAAMQIIRPLHGTELMLEFGRFYAGVSADRGNRYFSLIREFFTAYDEFGQVYFFVAKGMEISPHQHATSTDFEAVKMFYGNSYEQFTSLIETLAVLNNMLAGRKYDAFQTLTLRKYRELDRSARFGPFKDNETFMAICEEADHQIRNASHHGSFVFEQGPQTIRYRSGKGGTGP
jgi:hypothetical protein